MALNRCKECGNLFRSDVDICPNCETPVEKEKSRAGYLGVIGFILLVGLLSIQMNSYFHKKSIEKEKLRKQEAVLLEQEQQEQQEQEEAARMRALEEHYDKIVSLWKDGEYDQASNELDLFKEYNQPDYKEVPEIEKKLEIHRLEEQVKGIPASRASANLDIYKKLQSLDPDNERYKKKVSYYTNKIKKRSTKKIRKKKKDTTLAKGGKNKKENREKKQPVEKEESMEVLELLGDAPF
ncbi:MAG: hypothetical protein V2J25_00080 [Desulfatiglans sp.]|jgi:hypothetical protein|nr:hypothetical protein [Desulfatiglans sp.]